MHPNFGYLIEREYCERLGPFRLAMIPIGAYAPRYYMQSAHVDPSQAVDLHLEVRARQSMPLHWGTFNLAIHDWAEPMERTLRAARLAGAEIITPRIGETVAPDRIRPSSDWWRSVRWYRAPLQHHAPAAELAAGKGVE